jgi:hypothetical protein
MSFYTEFIQFLLGLFRLLSNIVALPHICVVISSLYIINTHLVTLSFRNIVNFVCRYIVFATLGIIINRLIFYIGVKILIISVLAIRLISALKEFIVTPSRFIEHVQNQLNIGKVFTF